MKNEVTKLGDVRFLYEKEANMVANHWATSNVNFRSAAVFV